MRNKRLIMWISAVLLILLSAMPGAYGFFSDNETRDNSFSVGSITTEIQEEFPNPSPVPIGENPSFRKKVWVCCDDSGGQTDCYVRISLAYSDYDIGKAVVLENTDMKNWEYDSGDGCYYYKKILGAGESSTPLFTGVHIDSSSLGKTDQERLKTFEISVYQEAVQAKGFTDFREAWTYYLNTAASA